MTQVDIDNDVYNSIKDFIENDKIEYPTIKNYIDKTLKKSLEKKDE